MLRTLTNRLFAVPTTVEQFMHDHPTTPVLAAGATKVIQLAPGQGDAIAYGNHWEQSVRGTLIATPDALICHVLPTFAPLHGPASGVPSSTNFSIPITTISHATVVTTRQGALHGLVLRVTVNDGRRFQFGLMADPAWQTNLPFPIHVESATIQRTRSRLSAHMPLALFFLIMLTLIACTLYQ